MSQHGSILWIDHDCDGAKQQLARRRTGARSVLMLRAAATADRDGMAMAQPSIWRFPGDQTDPA